MRSIERDIMSINLATFHYLMPSFHPSSPFLLHPRISRYDKKKKEETT